MQRERLAKPAPRPRWRRVLPWLGLGLLGWLLSRLDPRALGAAFARVHALPLAGASLMFSLNLLLKSVRWQRMLSAQGLRLPTRVAIAAFFSSQFYGQVTLGRLGELYRAEALIERKIAAGTALSSCVYDRVLDLGAVLVLAATLSAGVVGNMRAAIAAGAIMAALLVCALAVVRAKALAAWAPILRLRGWLERRRGTRGAVGVLGQLVSGLGPLLRPAFVIEATCWTGLAWLLYFGSLWVLADGMALSASRTALTAASALGALSSLLPVTISGLGAREVIFMNVLALERVAGPDAVALSLLHLSIMTLSAIGFGLIGMRARHRQQRAFVAAEVERLEAS